MRVIKWAYTLLIISMLSTPTLLLAQQEDEVTTVSAVEILKQNSDAVVLIVALGDEGEVTQGTGFIVSTDGLIITNYHVIEGVYPAIVKLANGDTYDRIDVVEWDARKDLAVIKIPGFNLTAVELGNSDSTQVGEKVVVIGNPKGLEHSITDGLLSASRDLEGHKVFQISAPISHGSSGSPVFNSKGEVIGVAFALIEDGQNLNFCIPINYARGLLGSNRRMTLEEFSKLKKEPMFMLSAGAPEMPRDEALKNFGSALSKLMMAQNIYICFLDEVRIGGVYKKKKFDMVKYHQPFIPSEIHVSQVLARDAARKFLNDFKNAPEDIRNLAHYIGNIANRHDEGLKTVFERIRNVNPTIDRPVIDKAFADIFDAKKDFDILYSDLVIIYEEVKTLSDEIQENYPYELIYDLAPERGYLGIWIVEYKDNLIIGRISDTSPVKKKFKRRDCLLGVVDGPKFNSVKEFRRFMDSTKPGQKVKFRIYRENKEKEIEVTLGERQAT